MLLCWNAVTYIYKDKAFYSLKCAIIEAKIRDRWHFRPRLKNISSDNDITLKSLPLAPYTNHKSGFSVLSKRLKLHEQFKAP